MRLVNFFKDFNEVIKKNSVRNVLIKFFFTVYWVADICKIVPIFIREKSNDIKYYRKTREDPYSTEEDLNEENLNDLILM